MFASVCLTLLALCAFAWKIGPDLSAQLTENVPLTAEEQQELDSFKSGLESQANSLCYLLDPSAGESLYQTSVYLLTSTGLPPMGAVLCSCPAAYDKGQTPNGTQDVGYSPEEVKAAPGECTAKGMQPVYDAAKSELERLSENLEDLRALGDAVETYLSEGNSSLTLPQVIETFSLPAYGKVLEYQKRAQLSQLDETWVKDTFCPKESPGSEKTACSVDTCEDCIYYGEEIIKKGMIPEPRVFCCANNTCGAAGDRMTESECAAKGGTFEKDGEKFTTFSLCANACGTASSASSAPAQDSSSSKRGGTTSSLSATDVFCCEQGDTPSCPVKPQTECADDLSFTEFSDCEACMNGTVASSRPATKSSSSQRTYYGYCCRRSAADIGCHYGTPDECGGFDFYLDDDTENPYNACEAECEKPVTSSSSSSLNYTPAYCCNAESAALCTVMNPYECPTGQVFGIDPQKPAEGLGLCVDFCAPTYSSSSSSSSSSSESADSSSSASGEWKVTKSVYNRRATNFFIPASIVLPTGYKDAVCKEVQPDTLECHTENLGQPGEKFPVDEYHGTAAYKGTKDEVHFVLIDVYGRKQKQPNAAGGYRTCQGVGDCGAAKSPSEPVGCETDPKDGKSYCVNFVPEKNTGCVDGEGKMQPNAANDCGMYLSYGRPGECDGGDLMTCANTCSHQGFWAACGENKSLVTTWKKESPSETTLEKDWEQRDIGFLRFLPCKESPETLGYFNDLRLYEVKGDSGTDLPDVYTTKPTAWDRVSMPCEKAWGSSSSSSYSAGSSSSRLGWGAGGAFALGTVFKEALGLCCQLACGNYYPVSSPDICPKVFVDQGACEQYCSGESCCKASGSQVQTCQESDSACIRGTWNTESPDQCTNTNPETCCSDGKQLAKDISSSAEPMVCCDPAYRFVENEGSAGAEAFCCAGTSVKPYTSIITNADGTKQCYTDPKLKIESLTHLRGNEDVTCTDGNCPTVDSADELTFKAVIKPVVTPKAGQTVTGFAEIATTNNIIVSTVPEGCVEYDYDEEIKFYTRDDDTVHIFKCTLSFTSSAGEKTLEFKYFLNTEANTEGTFKASVKADKPSPGETGFMPAAASNGGVSAFFLRPDLKRS